MNDLNTPFSSKQAFALRLFVGAAFGLAIALLQHRVVGRLHDVELAIWREILAATLVLTAFVIWAGAGSMRRISLAIWTICAFGLVYFIFWIANHDSAQRDVFFGGPTTLIFPLLFIAHELVSSGDQAGKWIAPYETYFDEAWKRGVQLALAILFTLLFWGILWLGAALLGFIGFDWLKKLLQDEYFSWPMTGLAFGTAVHLGDVQTKLLANVRSLILGVLSWLLPVITLIGAIFAGSLLVSGLAPLWATKAATATLLGGCIGFVLLINAAYQQGDIERPVPVFLKWCVRIAALLLLIFAVLAAWSLSLRIGQYGLSRDRIFAGLGVIIAVAYGIGYSVAVFVPGRWMGKLEPLNIGLAILKCALFIAVLTPIATPNRLTVNDQVARLNSGKVSVEKFDWWLLKDETGSYGKKALTKLAASSNSPIATKAKAALDNQIGGRPYFRGREPDVPNTPTPITERPDLSRIPVVSPQGAKLPKSFLDQDFTGASAFPTPSCINMYIKNASATVCKAALLDLNGDGQAEVLLREDLSLHIFTFDRGRWTGNNDSISLGGFVADFDAGNLRAAPSKWRDLYVGKQRQPIKGLDQPDFENAPSPSDNVAPPSNPK